MKALVLHPSGSSTMVQPANGSDFKLEELQELVGGWVEIVHYDDNSRIMVVNEKGIPKGFALNPKASQLVGIEIYGNAVTMPKEMFK